MPVRHDAVVALRSQVGTVVVLGDVGCFAGVVVYHVHDVCHSLLGLRRQAAAGYE